MKKHYLFLLVIFGLITSVAMSACPLRQVSMMEPPTKSAFPDFRTDIYTAEIRCDLKEIIDAGKYAWVGKNITQENFPVPSDCKYYDGDAHHLLIVKFRDGMKTIDEIWTQLDKAGLRPANLYELLSLGASHPDLQRHFRIIALGSRLRSESSIDFPVLSVSSGDRFLSLWWYIPNCREWFTNVRFLAVRK